MTEVPLKLGADETSETAVEEPVGLREAARELNLSPSTISRHVRDGIIPNRGTPDDPKVLLSEVEKAREANLDPSQQRGGQAPTYQAHRSNLEAAKAQKAQLELATMLGAVVDRSKVEDAIETAARELRDTLIRRWRVLAVEFEGLSAREIEAKGLASDEAALLELVRKLERVNAERSDVAVPGFAA